MAETHALQRRYPAELRERAVRMAQELVAEANVQSFGVVTRVARELGSGPSRCVAGSSRRRSKAAAGRGPRLLTGADRGVGAGEQGAAA